MKKILETIFIIIGIGFTTLFLLAIIIWSYYKVADKIEINQKILSKNNDFVAILLTNSGGGGPGYCQSIVSVVPNSTSEQYADMKNVVFRSDCNDDIKFRWDSEYSLAIDISKVDISSGISIYYKEQDNTERVFIKLINSR